MIPPVLLQFLLYHLFLIVVISSNKWCFAFTADDIIHMGRSEDNVPGKG